MIKIQAKDDVTVVLPAAERDVYLELPNGQQICLQWRLDSPSIDICVPEVVSVTLWMDDDLTPAQPALDLHPDGHQFRIKQMCLDINPAVLGRMAQDPSPGWGTFDW